MEMLGIPCREVAVEPIVVSRHDTVGEVLKVMKPNLPIFIIEKERVGVVEGVENAGQDDKVEKFATWVRPLSSEEPVYKAAQVMLGKEILSVPVNVEGNVKGITYRIVLGALKSTKELAKREARTIAARVPVVLERRIKNAENIARNAGVNVLPVVNDERKLIGVWINGKFTRRPCVVREGTRVKLVIEKVLGSPVVVINKHREPVGVITVWELLDLAASYRDVNVPVFYSGLETLPDLDREYVKGEVESTLRKIVKIVPVFYMSFNMKKRGTWRVTLKLSTPLRMFNISREGIEPLETIREALELMEREVVQEKEKRTEWKRIIRE